MSDLKQFYAGLDAGGTTFKCAIFDSEGKILCKERFPVTTPHATISACIAWFGKQSKARGLSLGSLGIASFGPVDVDTHSPDYGTILETPKPGWAGTKLRDLFANGLGIPVALDTDVNGALLAEMQLGAGRGAKSAAYVTIGTGIGAGIWADGQFLGRPSHPEFGHIPVQHDPRDVTTKSNCPFHTDCLEGFASAASMNVRFGDTRALEESHVGWEVEANYLAQACRSLYLTARLERIILGGGLMLADFLLEKVKKSFVDQMAGYASASRELADTMIVTPELGDDAGITGAMLLGKAAL